MYVSVTLSILCTTVKLEVISHAHYYRVSDADRKIQEIMDRVMSRTSAVLGDIGETRKQQLVTAAA